MSFRPATFCLALLLGVPAAGAGSLEALRQTARSSRDELDRVKTEQLTRRSELSELSKRIENLKASAKGRLLRGSELDAALKTSQDLSARLTELARVASVRQANLDGASVALLDALTLELSRLRGEFDRQTDRSARRDLLATLRQLRVEREAVRASLPAGRVPELEALKPTDDPEELLEQADLLRDNREKVTKELKGLDLRLAERRQEADLDRRLHHFLNEESMFDDQDRRLRVERFSQAPAQGATAANPPGGSSNSPPRDIAPGSGYNSTVSLDSAAASPTAFGGGTQVTTGSDARPEVGAGPLDLDRDGLERLEAERAKLVGLSESLARQAAALEARSAQLARPGTDAGQPVEPR